MNIMDSKKAQELTISSFKDKELLQHVFKIIEAAALEGKFEVILKCPQGYGVGAKVHYILEASGFEMYQSGSGEYCRWYK